MSLLECLEALGERLETKFTLQPGADQEIIRSAVTNVSAAVLFAWYEGLSSKAQNCFIFSVLPQVLHVDEASNIAQATLVRQQRFSLLDQLEKETAKAKQLALKISALEREIKELKQEKEDLATELTKLQIKHKRQAARAKQTAEEDRRASEELLEHKKHWRMLKDVLAFSLPFREEPDQNEVNSPSSTDTI